MGRLLLISAVFFFGSQALSADCGKFRVVKGNVTFKQKSKDSFKKARINKDICQGDTVKTEGDARAKIVMADLNEINISPESEMVIEDYQEGQKAVLNVIKGNVRSNVKQKYQDTNASHYRVKTKSAVAGVRGTEFMASYDIQTKESKVVTFEGEVNVGQLQDGKVVGKVSVKPGQFTSNRPGKRLHQPKNVPPRELAKMDRDTNVSDTPGGGQKGPASETPDQNDDSDDAGNDDQGKSDNDGAKESEGEASPKSEKGSDDKKGAGSEKGSDGVAGGSGDSTEGERKPASMGPNAKNNPPAPESNDPPPPPPPMAALPPPPPPVFNPDQLTRIPVPVCLTCNDAIINQKVRVTIVPVLPGQ